MYTGGAGGTVGAGLDPHEAERAIPAAAARMIAIFILFFVFGLWFYFSGFRALLKRQ